MLDILRWDNFVGMVQSYEGLLFCGEKGRLRGEGVPV